MESDPLIGLNSTTNSTKIKFKMKIDARTIIIIIAIMQQVCCVFRRQKHSMSSRKFQPVSVPLEIYVILTVSKSKLFIPSVKNTLYARSKLFNIHLLGVLQCIA